MQEKFLEHGGLEEHMSIDESMIPYYGKHFAKQFIRGKPIRFGFKVWALCSKHGYMHSFDLYLGKSTTSAPPSVNKLGVGGNVIMNLTVKAGVPHESGYKL